MNSNDSFLNVVIKLKASVLLSNKLIYPVLEPTAKYFAWGEKATTRTNNLGAS